MDQKWVKLAPNGTNPGLFQIRFQYILKPAHGYQIWTQNGSNWPQMVQIRDFCISIFTTFWLLCQNVLKSDLKKFRICPIWGQSDPFWVQNPGVSSLSPLYCVKSLKYDRRTSGTSEYHVTFVDVTSLVLGGRRWDV